MHTRAIYFANRRELGRTSRSDSHVSLVAARGAAGFHDPGARRDASCTASQCEGAIHQECAAGVSTRSATSRPFCLSSALLEETRFHSDQHRECVLRTVPSTRSTIAKAVGHRMSGSSASPEIITFVEGPWRITVAAHIALHSEYFNTVSICPACKPRVCRECPRSALKSRRRKSLPFHPARCAAVYHYARCHPVTRIRSSRQSAWVRVARVNISTCYRSTARSTCSASLIVSIRRWSMLPQIFRAVPICPNVNGLPELQNYGLRTVPLVELQVQIIFLLQIFVLKLSRIKIPRDDSTGAQETESKCHGVIDGSFASQQRRPNFAGNSRVAWILQYEIDRLHETYVS